MCKRSQQEEITTGHWESTQLEGVVGGSFCGDCTRNWPIFVEKDEERR